MGKVVWKKFEGDVAAELQIFGFVDHSHAAAADFSKDAVMGNRLPHGLGGDCHWIDMLGVSRWKVNVW